jgi:hypothetical protein
VRRTFSRSSIAAVGLVLAAAILAGGFVVARGQADSNYFGPNTPTWVRVPTTIGDPVYVGVLVLRARPGDTVELNSLVVEDLIDDTGVEPMVRILQGETRILGGIAESDLGETIDLSSYVPLSGLRFSVADGPVEFAVRVTGTTPVHGFNALRLRLRINGAAALEDWIPMRASICTGLTRAEAVERCRPIAEQMRSEGP